MLMTVCHWLATQNLKVLKFLDWAFARWETSGYGPRHFNYLPLPQGVVTQIENTWVKQMKYQDGKAVWSLRTN